MPGQAWIFRARCRGILIQSPCLPHGRKCAPAPRTFCGARAAGRGISLTSGMGFCRKHRWRTYATWRGLCASIPPKPRRYRAEGGRVSAGSHAENTAVLLLAHGTPAAVEEVPEFLLKVTGGRPLPQQVVEEIKHRYSLIGRSPLTELTMQQARLLAAELQRPVYVGMRNWK